MRSGVVQPFGRRSPIRRLNPIFVPAASLVVLNELGKPPRYLTVRKLAKHFDSIFLDLRYFQDSKRHNHSLTSRSKTFCPIENIARAFSVNSAPIIKAARSVRVDAHCLCVTPHCICEVRNYVCKIRNYVCENLNYACEDPNYLCENVNCACEVRNYACEDRNYA